MSSQSLHGVLQQCRKVAAIQSGRGLDDRELLRRFVAAQDEAAFTVLVERHGPMVFGVCRRALGNTADAEDAFQATFLILARKASSIRTTASVGSWLHRVARSVVVNLCRQRERRRQRERHACRPDPTDPHADVSWQELRAALDEELERLPERFRGPLILCYLEGHTRDEAARRLGLTPGTLHGLLERGRRLLGDRLTRRGLGLPAALLAGAVGEGVAREVPATVAVVSLTRAALTFAGGHSPATDLVAAEAIRLAREVLMRMTLLKVKLTTGAVLGGGLLLLAALGAQAPATAPPPDGPAVEQPPPKAGTGLAGRVVGPDGRPVSGAKIYVDQRPRPGGELVEVATTPADGTFQVAAPSREGPVPPTVYARKEGLGVAWQSLEEAGPVVLRLAADHPITGRVTDTEGKPVRGARVTAEVVSGPAEGTLGPALEALLADPSRGPTVAGRVLWPGRPGGIVWTTTDANGRFSLGGCGAERFVHVGVSGEGLAHKGAVVVNRKGFDPAAHNAAADRWRRENPSRPQRLLFGPDLRLVVEQGKTVEGVVIDALTKRPIAGATVTDARTPTRTDEAGRFRLDSLRKANSYMVYVGSPAGGDYLSQRVKVEDTEGYAPARCTVALRRGVAVTGRVTDRATGQPVRASVVVVPVAGNRFYAEYYPEPQFVDGAGHLTDADGRFRVVAVPGKLLVMVQARDTVLVGGERLPTYRGSGPDPAHPEVFDTKIQPGYAHVTLADMSLRTISNYEHGVRVLDVPPDGGPAVADFVLDRGVTGRIRVEGPDGKPVAGTTVFGLVHNTMPATIPGDAATVYALDPKASPQRVIAVSAARDLGGMATIRGDEGQPVVVQLAPLAEVRGKWVTADGQAVAGAVVLIDLGEEVEGLGTYLQMQFGVGTRTRTKTAADGTFTMRGLMPGVTYKLRMWKGKTVFPAEADAPPLTVRPGAGKVVDIGAVNIGTLKED